EILETLLPELFEALSDYEFYEQDKDRLSVLKDHMADRILNIVFDPFDELVFNEKLQHLNEEQVEIVENFIRIQDKLKTTIATKIADGISSRKKYTRLTWNGNQTELAELFQILINRGWINQPPNTKAFVNTLCEMFIAGVD